MDNALQVFTEDTFTARTFTDDDGTIWVVAKDVAQSLGYSEASINQTNNLFKAVPEIWADHKRIMVRSENGVEQEREMLCLTEQGLYFFLGRSDKKAALPYQIWVADKVVPSIRKHGGYLTPQKAEEIINNPDLIIKLAEEVKAERAKSQALAAKIEENRPKVLFAEAVVSSKDSILINELSKLIRQNGIDIGEKRFFVWLREHEYLCKTHGENWNLPTQRSMENGWFEIKKTVINDPSRGTLIRRTPKVTGKGQSYFINGFLSGKFRL